MSATYELRGPVAVITLDNPPVNGLGYDTRKGITDGLDKAQADGKVKAVVITGAGKAFSGGADIREFGSPKALQEPNLLSVIGVENALNMIVSGEPVKSELLAMAPGQKLFDRMIDGDLLAGAVAFAT